MPIWRERNQKKKKGPVDKREVIGSWIEETLFEFSSLDAADRAANKSTVGTVPVNLGGASPEDVHNWGDEMSNEPPAVREGGPMSYELGNLAALEEDDGARRVPVRARRSPPPTPVGARAGDAPAPVTRADDSDQTRTCLRSGPAPVAG